MATQKVRLIRRVLRVLPTLVAIVAWVLIAKDSDAQSAKISTKEFEALATKCAPQIDAKTLFALVKTESSFHPYAIAVVNGPAYYPQSKVEAQKIIAKLDATDKSYSVGLGQINRSNFSKFATDGKSLLEPCLNLEISAKVLQGCYASASRKYDKDSEALEAALSCYYSGNFDSGKRAGYVGRVVANSKDAVPSIDIIKQTQTNKTVEPSPLLVTTGASDVEATGPLI